MNDLAVDYLAIQHQREFDCGPLKIRTSGSPLAKGAVVVGHEHGFDHVSFVMAGAFHIEADDMDVRVRAPSAVNIRAGIKHRITSEEDGSVFWCAYPHRDEQGNVVAQYVGNWKAVQ